ncbi:MAG: recombinase [Chloroflexota bacterium]|nr:recombinase [Chloroflexota bacterium]
MPVNYEEYEQEYLKILADNEILLKDFESWLIDSGLAPKTIKQHCSSINFYINQYLLDTDPVSTEEGMDSGYISMFLGYWFIRKTMFASESYIKRYATSLKKFSKFLYEQNKMTKENYDSILTTIREEMPKWQATLKRYDDPSIESMEDVWGY